MKLGEAGDDGVAVVQVLAGLAGEFGLEAVGGLGEAGGGGDVGEDLIDGGGGDAGGLDITLPGLAAVESIRRGGVPVAVPAV